MSLLDELEQVFGRRITSAELAREAITHASLLNEPRGKGLVANARLAHLGDAVIGLAVRHVLYDRNPYDPGKLTDDAKPVVNRHNLTQVAKRLGLEKLVVGSRGLNTANSSVLGETYEALVGAMFLEQGYEEAAKLVVSHLLPVEISPPEAP